MQVVCLRGLDNNANIAINNVFLFAKELKLSKIDSSHLLYTMVKNKQVAEALLEDTGISSGDYRKTVEKIIGCRTVLNKNDADLSVDDLSEELTNILKETISNATGNNRVVTIMELYKAIIKSEDSSAWNVLKMMGVDRDLVLDRMSNPLAEMTNTAKFSVDYNILAREGRFDPVEAREDTINKIFEVLGRRIKNNPCIVGEAGVGKTAIVEGMAQRLITGNVPSYMKGKHIISVDISSIVAGAKYRGDFEERLNAVLDEVSKRRDVILFFDEFHMLADAGTSSGDASMSAANILKPAISRGDVQIIGATTTSEYKKFIERDKAFDRRMQKVIVNEPTIEDAIKMVNSVIVEYDTFHGCVTSEGAIEAAVVLSDRYITDKKLPDKAITVIDETAARLKKMDIFDDRIEITVSDIKDTISSTTGIDVSDLDDKARGQVKSLSNRIKNHVIGQDNAIDGISRAIARSKAGVKDPNRPVGSFLFVGPTGVGKTELTKALAIEFSGGIKNLIRFDMSEFMEKHSVSKLIGAPPGYVGYGEGGQLTEAVRNKPYSIVLFDEIEKAHPDVFNVLLQVLDDGQLTDSEGTTVDFKNTIIIMTSNAGYGAESFKKVTIGFNRTTFDNKEDTDKQEKIALKALESTFRPEFLNRLDKVVVFNRLSEESISEIVSIILKKLKNRLNEQGIEFKWDKSLVEFIVESGYSDKYGARNIRRKIQDDIEDKIADKIIDGELVRGGSIEITYNSGVDIKVYNSNIKAEELDFV